LTLALPPLNKQGQGLFQWPVYRLMWTSRFILPLRFAASRHIPSTFADS
jgi:hypothetical protein